MVTKMQSMANSKVSVSGLEAIHESSGRARARAKSHAVEQNRA